ncbi:poly(rc)-binding protein 1 [Phtheirospermum japonicum]|uniref:Poly(Rc)-binding protein 1 n=1 Tax=Phtheirospermum japonicum TaxID=374723 RepID=A0A830B1H7_9LAMI|nr:poly(rc)-binding protein 1 [Phtheirospermum japonicum]
MEEDGDAEASKLGVGHVAPNTVRILIAGCQAGGVIETSGVLLVMFLQMSGEIPAVLRAVVEIGCQLRDHPPKQVISVSPKIKTGVHRQSQQYMDPNSADYATMDIMVPENLVGGLIGRFGANISRIRNESGANIKVHGGRGEQTQRQIHLCGSARQVALAKLRVDEYVYAELMRQAGGQVPQTPAGQYQQYPSQSHV